MQSEFLQGEFKPFFPVPLSESPTFQDCTYVIFTDMFLNTEASVVQGIPIPFLAVCIRKRCYLLLSRNIFPSRGLINPNNHVKM